MVVGHFVVFFSAILTLSTINAQTTPIPSPSPSPLASPTPAAASPSPPASPTPTAASPSPPASPTPTAGTQTSPPTAPSPTTTGPLPITSPTPPSITGPTPSTTPALTTVTSPLPSPTPSTTTGPTPSSTPALTTVPALTTPSTPFLSCFDRYPNTNTLQGRQNRIATTLHECARACVANSQCQGIDWNANAQPDARCWLSGSWTTGWVNGTANGITHYEIRRECLGQTSPPALTTSRSENETTITTTTVAPVDGKCFTPYRNSKVANSQLNSNVVTLQQCFEACINNIACTGIDWISNGGQQNQRCYLVFASSGQWTNGTAIGVTHWQLDRNCTTSNVTTTTGTTGSTTTTTLSPFCRVTWIRMNNTNVIGGQPVNGTKTLSECQMVCIRNASCTGVDWNPDEYQGMFCWLSGPWSGGRNTGTVRGITHYDIVRGPSCPGGRSPPTTPSPIDCGLRCSYNTIALTFSFISFLILLVGL